MRVTTLVTIAGRVVDETLGAVRGTALWSRRILKNKTVGMRAMAAPVMAMPFAHPANDFGAVVVPFMPRRTAAY